MKARSGKWIIVKKVMDFKNVFQVLEIQSCRDYGDFCNMTLSGQPI